MTVVADTMMTVSNTPWHSSGTVLKDVPTSEEAINAAGLNWTVVKRPLYLPGQKRAGDWFATVRNDSDDVLGVVKERYTPLQNKDAFKFFDTIVGAEDAIYHTAGSMAGGRAVWILAKLPGEIRVLKDDVTDKYLLLTSRHDGAGAVSMMFTPIRSVCQNTLAAAHSHVNKRDMIRLRHTASIKQRVDEARENLGIINKHYVLLAELAERMTEVSQADAEFFDYAERVGVIPKKRVASGPAPGEAEQMMLARAETRRQNIIDTLTSVLHTGKGTDIPGLRGTVWGGYNAIVEYVDFHRHIRSNRGKNILFGTGAALKERALKVAEQLVR